MAEPTERERFEAFVQMRLAGADKDNAAYWSLVPYDRFTLESNRNHVVSHPEKFRNGISWIGPTAAKLHLDELRGIARRLGKELK